MELTKYYELGRYTDEMQSWRENIFFPKRLHLIESLLEKPIKGKVLDIGCGDGTLLKVVRNKFPKTELYGCDITAAGLKRAKKLGIKSKIVDINNGLAYEDNFFDVLIAHEVIEHIIDPDYFLEESFRVLRKGGILIFTTPNLTAWYNRVLFLFGIIPIFMELSTKDRTVGMGITKKLTANKQPVGHIRIFTKLSLIDLLLRANFKETKFVGDTVDFSPNILYKIFDKLFSSIPSLSSNLIFVAKK